MKLEMPLPNTMYKTKQGHLVLCMSANQWILKKKVKGENFPEYNLQITTRPVKVKEGIMVQNNKGHFGTQYFKKEGYSLKAFYFKKEGYSLEGIPNRLDTTPEDFQKIHKMFQEAK